MRGGRPTGRRPVRQRDRRHVRGAPSWRGRSVACETATAVSRRVAPASRRTAGPSPCPTAATAGRQGQDRERDGGHRPATAASWLGLGHEVEQPLDGARPARGRGPCRSTPPEQVRPEPPGRPRRAPRTGPPSTARPWARRASASSPTTLGSTAAQTSTNGWPVTSTCGWSDGRGDPRLLRPGHEVVDEHAQPAPRPRARRRGRRPARSSMPSSISTTMPSTRRSSPQTFSSSSASWTPSTKMRRGAGAVRAVVGHRDRPRRRRGGRRRRGRARGRAGSHTDQLVVEHERPLAGVEGALPPTPVAQHHGVAAHRHDLAHEGVPEDLEDHPAAQGHLGDLPTVARVVVEDVVAVPHGVAFGSGHGAVRGRYCADAAVRGRRGGARDPVADSP